MNVLACGLGFLGAALSIFQEAHIASFLPGFSVFDLFRMMTGPMPGGAQPPAPPDVLMILTLMIVAAAVSGVVGGVVAFHRRGGIFPLIVSALLCLGVFGYVNIQLRHELPFMSGYVFHEVALWAIIYLAAAACAKLDKTGQSSEAS